MGRAHSPAQSVIACLRIGNSLSGFVFGATLLFVKKKNILFLCTGNSIRSQMGEAFMRHFGGDRVNVYSAGVSPSGIHPLTVYMMEEEGIDISKHYSKGLKEIPVDDLDLVITLCGNAREGCPVNVLQKPNEHWPINDPISFSGSEAMRIGRFRETKEDVKGRVKDWLLRADWT